MNTNIITAFESIPKCGLVAPMALNGLPGMSSLEVSEITGKRHDNVLRDIKKMLEELGYLNVPKSELIGESEPTPALKSELGSSKFVETSYPDAQGQKRPITILDKELTFTLMARYSFTMANLIVKRWFTLEGAGFARVSIQAAVVHLVERENDNRRVALQALKRGPRTPRKLTAEEEVNKKYKAQASYARQKAHKQGAEWH